jgi:hypothetical protein
VELILLALSCGEFEGEASPPAADAAAPEMTAVALLTRASLDLRGVRPSVEEIESVEIEGGGADLAAVDAAIQSYLQDPRFGSRVRSIFADIYLTRRDWWYVNAADYGLTDTVTEPQWAESVGDEPLRLLSTIAEEDLPYTDIVLADWTMADERLGAAWPLQFDDGGDGGAYPPGESGWRKARYTDGRPLAGVLTTNAMWWRYMTNDSNANRGRANAVSRILLCSDYLSRPIEFDRNVNLLDQGAVNDALKTNAGCLACHSTLDPFAGYFWGFHYYFYDSAVDTTSYHADREHLWDSHTGVAPGYYGLPGNTLQDLGRQIAQDPRLTSCVTQQVFSALQSRPVELDDTANLLVYESDFAASGYTLRALFYSVVSGEEYRSGPTDDLRMTPKKMISADLLASSVEGITGFRFSYAGYDMLQTDTYGLRTLAGGVDGVYNSVAATEPTATLLLVQERLAEAAAAYAVDVARSGEGPGKDLFTEVDFSETPANDPDAMVAQLQRLHLAVLGNRVAADGPEVAAGLELWTDLYSVTHSPAEAWAGLLAVLLRDPDFLLY